MRLLKSLLLFIIVSSLFSCKSSTFEENTSNQKLKCHLQLGSDELKEDFRILTTTLSDLHPNLYRVHSKEIIDSRIAKINEGLSDSLSYLEFLKRIVPLLTDVGCINTTWGHSKAYVEYRNKNIPIFPIKFNIQDERFIIEENYSSNHDIKKGEEITAINAVSIPKYLENNYPLLPIDGNIKSIQLQWLASYFPNHHSNFWEQTDTFYLKIQDQNGVTREERVIALLKENIGQKSKEKKPLSFELRDSIALLKISTFNNNVLKRNKQQLEAFLDSSFQKIKEINLKHLILDVRGNSWGDIDNGALLLSYLVQDDFQYIEAIKSHDVDQDNFNAETIAPGSLYSTIQKEFTKIRSPQSLNYNGRLYVITDGWNINAGGYFCSKIKNRPNTELCGEQAGSSSFGMNAINKNIILPHSGINFYIPTYTFIANKNEQNNIEGTPLDLMLEPPYIENTIKHIQQK